MSGDSGGFTLVDFSIPNRDNAIAHPSAAAPLCDDCRTADLCFFDPTCSGCQDILLDSKTSIPELFAVMRQYVPQTQRNMGSLAREVLRRGANVNDRDGLTDLTLLHFACKSGAPGVGNETSAVNLVNSLITKGADTTIRCRWTNMNALHYAVFFDVSEVVQVLAEHNPALLTSFCSEFNGGNVLHIAATNLCLKSARVLLSHGTDGSLKDRDGKLPHECVPSVFANEQEEVARELTELLEKASENPPIPKIKRLPASSSTGSTRLIPSPSPRSPLPKSPVPLTHEALPIPRSPVPKPAVPVSKSPAPSHSTVSSIYTTSATSGSSGNESPVPEEITMETLGLKIGDRIIIDAKAHKPKFGTIRFGGTTEFALGQWAGIELDEDIGKNDGSYGGIRYFTCKPKFGLFVPMQRISKAVRQPRRRENGKNRRRDTLYVTTKAIEAQAQLQMNTDLQIGERVVVSGRRPGVLRFAGTVKFAPGFWLGMELDRPNGKNDGSRSGVRYFRCKPNHGVFALPSKVKRLTPSMQEALQNGEAIDHPFTSSSDSSNRTGTPSPGNSPRTRRRPISSAARSSRLIASKSSKLSHSTPATPISLSQSPSPTLEEGMSVFASGEMGTVRYIGTTEFAEGTWIGVELRRPSGKNDGSVQGKRYFTCKPNHGLFIKPEKASHRGINCSKLMHNTD